MALAAGGEGQAAVSRILFALGVLLLAANLGGLAAERLGQPPVLGELVIGIVLASLVVLLRGAEAVAYVQSEPTLQILAEVGVLILLFDASTDPSLRPPPHHPPGHHVCVHAHAAKSAEMEAVRAALVNLEGFLSAAAATLRPRCRPMDRRRQ